MKENTFYLIAQIKFHGAKVNNKIFPWRKYLIKSSQFCYEVVKV